MPRLSIGSQSKIVQLFNETWPVFVIIDLGVPKSTVYHDLSIFRPYSRCLPSLMRKYFKNKEENFLTTSAIIESFSFRISMLGQYFHGIACIPVLYVFFVSSIFLLEKTAEPLSLWFLYFLFARESYQVTNVPELLIK